MKIPALAAALLLAALFVAPASADVVGVFTIGSNPAGLALDPIGNPIGGAPIISWNHVSAGGSAVLSILAEGIDTDELDEVLFNGVSIGFLTNQGFGVTTFNLNPGPGAMADGSTANTVSIFNVIALPGINTVDVLVDTENWVNEIEVSVLEDIGGRVPEPGTWALMVTGAALLGIKQLRRRSRG